MDVYYAIICAAAEACNRLGVGRSLAIYYIHISYISTKKHKKIQNV